MFNLKFVKDQKFLLPFSPRKYLGLFAETKKGENRVLLTPYGISEFLRAYPQEIVFIQKGAGLRSGFSDEEYKYGSANPKNVQLLNSYQAVAFAADIIGKVKEPTYKEIDAIKPFGSSKSMISYFHPASNRDLTLAALESKANYFALETARKDGRTILLDPMSIIAGQISIDQAKEFFKVNSLSGKKIAVLGGLGVAGWSAVQKALAENAESVKVFDLPHVINRRYPEVGGTDRVHFYDSKLINFENLKDVDVIVTAPYRYGQKPPVLLGEELSSLLDGLGRLIFVCDISIDQGGSTYLTSIATAPQHHGDAPIPFNKNLYHTFIANMPSIAGARASKELEQAVLPYLLKLFELRKKFKQDGVLSSALNFSGGHNVLEGLGADLKIPYTPLENIDYEDSQDLWTR